MPDEEFDLKVERAGKALGILKQLGDAFGGGKKEQSPLNDSNDTLVNSIFFIENQIRNMSGDIGDIKTMLSKSQQIKDLIAFIEREKFTFESELGKQLFVNATEVLQKLNGIL